MIELIINNEVMEVSTDLSIKQFQELNRDSKRFNNNPAAILSLYLGLDENKIKKLPKKQVDFVLNYLTDEMVNKVEKELIMTFTHKGVKYGLENDWMKLPWGAWSDFEILSSANVEENINHIMAVLYRPVIWEDGTKYKIMEYDSEEIMERVEEFKNLPIRYWFGATDFFLQIVKLYITDLETSLSWTNKVNNLTMKTWKKLPQFLRKRLPLDSILLSHSISQVKILPKLRK
jgi:hypothetical protein